MKDESPSDDAQHLLNSAGAHALIYMFRVEAHHVQKSLFETILLADISERFRKLMFVIAANQ